MKKKFKNFEEACCYFCEFDITKIKSVEDFRVITYFLKDLKQHVADFSVEEYTFWRSYEKDVKALMEAKGIIILFGKDIDDLVDQIMHKLSPDALALFLIKGDFDVSEATDYESETLMSRLHNGKGKNAQKLLEQIRKEICLRNPNLN